MNKDKIISYLGWLFLLICGIIIIVPFIALINEIIEYKAIKLLEEIMLKNNTDLSAREIDAKILVENTIKLFKENDIYKEYLQKKDTVNLTEIEETFKYKNYFVFVAGVAIIVIISKFL